MVEEGEVGLKLFTKEWVESLRIDKRTEEVVREMLKMAFESCKELVDVIERYEKEIKVKDERIARAIQLLKFAKKGG